jgi:hypothetical protein
MAERRSGGDRRSSEWSTKFPRPPVKNMTDFVVFAFVTIVAIMLIGGVTAFIILALIDPDRDMSRGVGIFADITTSLISALVGFLAGKGQGAQDAHDREMERLERERNQGKPPEAPPS